MAPPLPPTHVGASLNPAFNSTIQCELFLDLCCPFSKKMFVTLVDGLILNSYYGTSVGAISPTD